MINNKNTITANKTFGNMKKGTVIHSDQLLNINQYYWN